MVDFIPVCSSIGLCGRSNPAIQRALPGCLGSFGAEVLDTVRPEARGRCCGAESAVVRAAKPAGLLRPDTKRSGASQ